MKNGRKLIVATLALAGLVGAGVAEARDHADVQWSVTIGNPNVLPVYGRPVEVRPAVPVHRGYQRPTRWDVDGDGIPNRYDRVYNPRWDRDGDGIPNRYDRRDGRGYDGQAPRHDGHYGAPQWRGGR